MGHPDFSGVEILTARELAGKTYSALLVVKIREMLAEAGVLLGQVAAVVVVNGPGSFTGVRIGVSAAKGLAEALEIPIIALSRLELLALNASADACAVLDAGRGEFYVRMGGHEALLGREALLRMVNDAGASIVVCEEKAAVLLAEANPLLIAAPTAKDALRLGSRRWLAGNFDDVVLLDGNYLRRSDAELFARPKATAPERR